MPAGVCAWKLYSLLAPYGSSLLRGNLFAYASRARALRAGSSGSRSSQFRIDMILAHLASNARFNPLQRHTSKANITRLPAKILSSEKRGDQYCVPVKIEPSNFRRSFNSLQFGEIGTAPCRERVDISVVAVSLKKKGGTGSI